jgi:hypothetical protein
MRGYLIGRSPADIVLLQSTIAANASIDQARQ